MNPKSAPKMTQITNDPDSNKSNKSSNLNITALEMLYILAGSFFVFYHFCFFDDSFIYFRYIDNLIFLRIGLVYNAGEYVEGFSSPLWLFLVSIPRSLGFTYFAIIYTTTFLLFISFCLMLIHLNRLLSSSLSYLINFPLLYLALNYGVLSHFSTGLETPLIQVIAVAYAIHIIKPSSRFIQILLAGSPLIRHELIIPLIMCMAWYFIRNKTTPIFLLFTTLALNAAYLIFRIYYYADLLPNTFYLKDVFYPYLGIKYVHGTLSTYHLYEVFLGFSIIVLLLIRHGIKIRIMDRIMMIAIGLPVVLHVVKIGGDMVHYRYLAFPFILVVCAFAGIMESGFQILSISKYKTVRYGICASLMFLVASFYPPQLSQHPFFFQPIGTAINNLTS